MRVCIYLSCLSVYISIVLAGVPYIYHSVNQSVILSFYPSVVLFIVLLANIYIYLCCCVYRSVYCNSYHSISLSVVQPMCQSVIFFVVLTIIRIILIYLSFYLLKYLGLGVQISSISTCSLLVMFALGELAYKFPFANTSGHLFCIIKYLKSLS